MGFKFCGLVFLEITISVFGAKSDVGSGDSGYKPGNSGFRNPDTPGMNPDIPGFNRTVGCRIG